MPLCVNRLSDFNNPLMSDRNKSLFSQVAFWTLLLTITGLMCKGVWLASEVHKDVQLIKAELPVIRQLENRVLRIETKLGISKRSRDTNSVMIANGGGDL